MTVIALGWKELGGRGIPKVLYVGTDVDQANQAITLAGKNKAIAAGEILRGIEDRVIRRVVFDAPVRALVPE
jgi:hypothetical protein